ncbi:hypothetical protein X798_01992 [Onchocerca flexuosa]|uniref:Uncharacterized protein n=2 Tax=Onchocerca flexuosa TaxID=387005 RepID=A0A183HJW0_9BILA|nr:hypothetical protein X798_01992 [Onchocerca flexuosa]VDO52459.1 unnamed protein product [Onchocerca flexuosa]
MADDVQDVCIAGISPSLDLQSLSAARDYARKLQSVGEFRAVARHTSAKWTTMHVGSAESACKECVLHRRRTKQIALERKNFCTSLCVFFVYEPSDVVRPPGIMKSGGPPSLSIHPSVHVFSLYCITNVV